MSIDSNYANNVTYSQLPQASERKSKIYYANNETIPPEKRVKEISDEDYQKMSKQFVGSVRAPKASTLRNFMKNMEEWFTKYMEKPHRLNVDKIEKNANTVLDIIDGSKRPVAQANGQSPDSQQKVRLSA